MSRTEEKLVEMTNGCICCTLREDLLAEVTDLARDGRFDYLLIESTGISERAPVADTFTFRLGDGTPLSEIARLHTMVTVVDAANFLSDLQVGEDLRSLDQAATKDDPRTVANLLTEQVEFANVILLNKTDLVDEDRLAKIEGFIDQLNSHALKHRSSFGHCDSETMTPVTMRAAGSFMSRMCSTEANFATRLLTLVHRSTEECLSLRRRLLDDQLRQGWHPLRHVSLLSRQSPRDDTRSQDTRLA